MEGDEIVLWSLGIIGEGSYDFWMIFEVYKWSCLNFENWFIYFSIFALFIASAYDAIGWVIGIALS